MSNNNLENDFVWLNNVSVHDEIEFSGNGHKTGEEYQELEKKENIKRGAVYLIQCR